MQLLTAAQNRDFKNTPIYRESLLFRCPLHQLGPQPVEAVRPIVGPGATGGVVADRTAVAMPDKPNSTAEHVENKTSDK
jgi:hypothetical protein